MSADIQISAPGRSQRRLGTYSDSHPSGEHMVVPAQADEADGSLRWAADSTAVEEVERSGPRMRQLMGVCGWAAILGLVGLVVGARGFIADLGGNTPGWYEPSLAAVGAAGIGLTIAAFISVRRRRLPYVLLGGATLALIYAILLTVTALG